MASEDIGEADPHLADPGDRRQGCLRFLGSPRGRAALAQVCVHMAAAPKSTAVYAAFGAALAHGQGDRLADAAGPHPQRAERLMKQLGYGKGYQYDPHTEEGLLRPGTISPKAWSGGPSMRRRAKAPRRGVKERLERWASLRREKGGA
ncbi:MAG: hypothetical protein WDM85_01205 [Caulobacteraceae bacterium]